MVIGEPKFFGTTVGLQDCDVLTTTSDDGVTVTIECSQGCTTVNCSRRPPHCKQLGERYNFTSRELASILNL